VRVCGSPAIYSDPTAKLAEFLRKHLGKDRIIIIGHSFGSIVGVLMARADPISSSHMWAQAKLPMGRETIMPPTMC
jgi:pimeloyl-ACP methyl ester carboxylesterase